LRRNAISSNQFRETLYATSILAIRFNDVLYKAKAKLSSRYLTSSRYVSILNVTRWLCTYTRSRDRNEIYNRVAETQESLCNAYIRRPTSRVTTTRIMQHYMRATIIITTTAATAETTTTTMTMTTTTTTTTTTTMMTTTTIVIYLIIAYSPVFCPSHLPPPIWLFFYPPASQRDHRGATADDDDDDDNDVVDDVAPVRESNDRQMLRPEPRATYGSNYYRYRICSFNLFNKSQSRSDTVGSCARTSSLPGGMYDCRFAEHYKNRNNDNYIRCYTITGIEMWKSILLCQFKRICN